MLSDTEFLLKFIKSIAFTDIWDFLAIKNLHGAIIYATPKFANIFKLTSQDMLGKTVNQYVQNEQLRIVYQEQDKLVYNSQTIHHFLNIFKFDSLTTSLFLTTKKPILNPFTNQVIGLVIVIDKYHANIDKIQIINQAHRIHSLQKNIQTQTFLTKREREVIFLLINGYTAKEAAKLIECIEEKSLSESTIKTIILRLKEKFNVANLASLISVALSKGYGSFIPDSFLPETSLHICQDNCSTLAMDD